MLRMSEFKLTTEGIRYIALFESLTGGMARDCVVDEDNDTNHLCHKERRYGGSHRKERLEYQQGKEVRRKADRDRRV